MTPSLWYPITLQTSRWPSPTQFGLKMCTVVSLKKSALIYELVLKPPNTWRPNVSWWALSSRWVSTNVPASITVAEWDHWSPTLLEYLQWSTSYCVCSCRVAWGSAHWWRRPAVWQQLAYNQQGAYRLAFVNHPTRDYLLPCWCIVAPKALLDPSPGFLKPF